MNLPVFIKNALICAFEVYMLTDLGEKIFQIKSLGRKRRILLLSGSIVLLTVINGFNRSYLNLLFVPPIYVFLSIILYLGSIIKKFSLAICYYLLVMAPEFIFALVINLSGTAENPNISHNGLQEILLILAMKVCTFILVKCIGQIQKKRRYTNIKDKYFISLLVLPMATMILFISLFYADIHVSGSIKTGLVTGASFLLFSNAFMFYLFDKLVINMEKIGKMEKLYAKSRIENKNLRLLEKVNEKHRILLHDINKYLRTAGELIAKGYIIDAERLFDKVETKIQNNNSIPFCRHKILNAILYERKEKADELDILFRVNISPDLYVEFIDDIDLISIVGNLLDNALEAAAQVKQGGYVEINIFMANEGHFLLLEVKNNFITAPVKRKSKFISSKDNKEEHGIGIHTMEKIVRIYGGKLKINIQPNVFTASIIFNVNKNA